MRGKPELLRRAVIAERLIPACAGKTVQELVCDALEWAHPRVCGENQQSLQADDLKPGSSPRVRGKLAADRYGRYPVRLIPACAGKTPRRVGIHAAHRAHPRVCGENWKNGSIPGLPSGSSPRVRGKPRGLQTAASQTGLIPACAGKTVHSKNSLAQDGAHPRVCGENLSPKRSTLI